MATNNNNNNADNNADNNNADNDDANDNEANDDNATVPSIANEMRRPFVIGPLVALGRCATDFSSEKYSRFLPT